MKKKLTFSKAVLTAIQILPVPARARFLLWRKARAERRAIAGSDIVIVSYAKSGRTWFRVMLSRIYASIYNLDQNMLLKRDNFHALESRAPVVFFTHGTSMTKKYSPRELKSMFSGKKILFLVRHPADVAVSNYFHHLGGRENPLKRDLNNVPASMKNLSISDFAFNCDWGVSAIINYLNYWHAFFKDDPNVLTIRYEDLHANPNGQFRRIASFLGENFSEDIVAHAVESASFNRLQTQERSGTFRNSALRPRDPLDANSFKVRRGKVKGYVDYFTEAETAKIEELIQKNLTADLGYGSA